jgi:hypothetical protein
MGLLLYLRVQWDRVAAWVCVAGGAVALLMGYAGVSDTLSNADQIPYVVSGGLVGIFLLGLGALLWLSADLRDEWRKLDEIERQLTATGALPRVSENHGERPATPHMSPPTVGAGGERAAR